MGDRPAAEYPDGARRGMFLCQRRRVVSSISGTNAKASKTAFGGSVITRPFRIANSGRAVASMPSANPVCITGTNLMPGYHCVWRVIGGLLRLRDVVFGGALQRWHLHRRLAAHSPVQHYRLAFG